MAEQHKLGRLRTFLVEQKDVFGKLGTFIVQWYMSKKRVEKTFPQAKVLEVKEVKAKKNL